MAEITRLGPSPLELHFTAPFGVVLRVLRKAAGRTQLQLAVELHRDHTNVSRWEKGSSRPAVDEVGRIAHALRLPSTERRLLHSAWARSSGETSAVSSGELLASLRAVATLRRVGQPRIAYELAGSVGRAALQQTRSTRLSTDRLRQVLSVVGELLFEEVKAALDFAPRAQLDAGMLTANLRDHRLVRDALDDRRAHQRFALTEEAVLYRTGRIAEAHRSAQALLDELTVEKIDWLAEVIRAVAINSGLVDDQAALLRAWARFREVRIHLPDPLARFALEGFARGFAPVAPRRALEIVRHAARAAEQHAEPSAVKRAQLARTEGRLVIGLSGALADGETRQRMERALALSRSVGLSRYVTEIEELLGHASSRHPESACG